MSLPSFIREGSKVLLYSQGNSLPVWEQLEDNEEYEVISIDHEFVNVLISNQKKQLIINQLPKQKYGITWKAFEIITKEQRNNV